MPARTFVIGLLLVSLCPKDELGQRNSSGRADDAEPGAGEQRERYALWSREDPY
jgi:hypothetical protein